MRMLPFERAVSATTVSDVQIAPDGGRIVYVAAESSHTAEHPTSAIWIVDADGDNAAPRPLTAGIAADTSPRFSPDGTRIAFLSTRGGENVAQLYLLPLDGGEAVCLTDHKTGVAAPLWSPDGSTIAYTARPDETDDARTRRETRDDARVLDTTEGGSALWLLTPTDATTGHLPAPRRLSPEGLNISSYLGAPFAWSPDGSTIVALTAVIPETNAFLTPDVVTIRVADGTVQTIATLEGPAGSPIYSPDGTTLAVIAAANRLPGRAAIVLMTATGGERRVVAPDFPGTVSHIAWLPDGTLAAQTEEGQHGRLRVITPDTGAVSHYFPPVPGVVGYRTAFSITADGSRAAFAFADAHTVCDVVVADRDTAPRPRTHLNPWLAEYDLGEMREISWQSSDGMEIHGILILPAGYEEGTAYPLLTHIHGGPAAIWSWHVYAGWHDWGQFMAQRGYAVFMPNPRGSTGRGTAFLTSIIACYGEPDWQDIITGVDMLVAQGIADPDKLVVGGWSGGGFLTNTTITRTDRFKAAISGAGIGSWVSFRATTDVRVVFDRYMDDDTANLSTFTRLSPIQYAGNAHTPTLFLHGEQDFRVPIAQGYEMYRALQHNGTEAQMVTYPREPHGIGERLHQLDLLRRVTAWYDTHLGRTSPADA